MDWDEKDEQEMFANNMEVSLHGDECLMDEFQLLRSKIAKMVMYRTANTYAKQKGVFELVQIHQVPEWQELCQWLQDHHSHSVMAMMLLNTLEGMLHITMEMMLGDVNRDDITTLSDREYELLSTEVNIYVNKIKEAM